MTEPFEQLRAEQDGLRARAGYLERARSRRGIAAAPRRTTVRRAAPWALAAALAVGVGAAVWLRWPMAAEPLAFRIGDRAEHGTAGAFVAAPPDRELPLRFDDGTRFALTAGTSARVASLDARGAHLVIEKGGATAAVVHRQNSRWRVDAGPFQVVVVGTRFDVSWDAATRILDLKLYEGSVRVSGGMLSDELNVRAGQRLRAFADAARVEMSDDAGVEAAQASAHPVEPGAHEPEATLNEPAAAAPDPSSGAGLGAVTAGSATNWLTLAASGKYRDAVAAAEKEGFEAECRRASGSDLLVLADAARLSGSAARAEQAYSAARAKLPGGGRASYGLGLVAFDLRADFASAARHFETYLREQPSGSLRVEATGRMMEALQRAGRLSEARRIAEQYLARYPRGPQAARARQLLQ